MFDRVIVQPSPRAVYNYETVTEKRAPTDESVRLLKELEAAAQAKVVESIKVGDTAFECVIHTMFEPSSQDMLAAAYFSLNGKKIEVRVRCPAYNTTVQGRIDALIEAISERIAVEIVRPALRSLWR